MPKEIAAMIVDECFWEYDFVPQQIDALAHSTEKKEQVFLFDKILANATHLLRSMEIFDRATLGEMIASYTVPTFNHDFFLRRIRMLEYYFLGKPLTIRELQWVA